MCLHNSCSKVEYVVIWPLHECWTLLLMSPSDRQYPSRGLIKGAVYLKGLRPCTPRQMSLYCGLCIPAMYLHAGESAAMSGPSDRERYSRLLQMYDTALPLSIFPTGRNNWQGRQQLYRDEREGATCTPMHAIVRIFHYKCIQV